MYIYNSLSASKQLFTPRVAGKVGLYVCGITVYDYCHIGHARTSIAFDVVYRYLRAKNYAVTYVRNITDVDDKIIVRAAENNENIDALTERFILAMHEDFDALGVLPPDLEPRATEFMGNIVAVIEKLLAKDFAYIAPNADIYFAVDKCERYGELSQQNLEELKAGARVDVNEQKRNPLDFVLWKCAKPGEPSWDSPWGPGRPGWHTECVAMSTECLGNSFDIHGGGRDLCFPHHENEIAQAEAMTGQKFVNIWMHAGFLNIADEKMSKSLGNFFTIREVLAHNHPEVIRLFFISSHYRSNLNYSADSLGQAQASLERLYLALRKTPLGTVDHDCAYTQEFYRAMDDDFNTPEALAVLFELSKEVNRCRLTEPARCADLAATLKYLGAILGVLQRDPETFLQGQSLAQTFEVAEIEALIADRLQARKDRDFAKADKIRDLLKLQGVIIEDNAGGTEWRRER